MRRAMDEHRLELKVGLLLVLALGGVVALLYLLGEIQLTPASTVRVQFTHTGGVPQGAPVKFAGVRVGRVARLQLMPARRDAEGHALPVDMDVEIDRAIFADLGTKSRFQVATQGPLGEPFLEIDPGPATPDKLLAGAVVRGVDPPRMDLLSAKLYAFVDQATNLLGSSSGSEAKSVITRIVSLAEKAEGTLDEARPKVVAAVDDMSAAARELRTVAQAASGLLNEKGTGRRMVEDLAVVSAQLRKDLPGITEKAQKAADGAAQLAGSFTAEDVAKLKEAIERYEKAGASLHDVASKADRLLTRIEAGEGTLGGLAKDPAVYQDLKSLVTDLKKHPWKVLWKD